MLMLKTISSGSCGNSYSLICDKEILMLDLGVNSIEIKKNIDFRVTNIVGCLITHKHT